MAPRIATAAPPRSHPRIVCILSCNVLDFAGDAARDAVRQLRNAWVARGAGPRQIDRLLVEDAPGASPHEDHAVGEAHGLADVVRDEADRLARGAPDALDLAL